MRHYVSFSDMSPAETRGVLCRAREMKRGRGRGGPRPLEGEHWAMLFAKASTRTRVSFEIGLRELGAGVVFMSGDQLQLGRGEPIEDTARVLGRMFHGAVIRTFAQSDLETFARHSGIVTVNALTDAEHPCQILADIFTIEELRGPIEAQHIAFVGDGACNVPVSWILAARALGFRLTIAAPRAYQPERALVEGGGVRVTESVEEAVRGADVLYSDVWVSMGKEAEAERRLADLRGYQINRECLALAAPGALVMHCLPAYRGMEITDEVIEAHASTIFTQAENRLHVQKALIAQLCEWRGAGA